MRCRGGASPSRRRTGVISGPSIKRGWPPRFVIARRPQADVAISQFPAASWESYRRNRNCLPEIATAPLGPRNDTSGQRSNGNGAAHRIGGTTAASRTGGACPAPTGPVRIERRPAYDPFFILQYSLFIISSIPLRGMANHMTNRPEIPCLSCKFPQSRRICH